MPDLARRAALIGALVGTLLPSARAQATTPVIAAAAHMQFALEEIAAAFAAKGEGAVKLAFGASGNLARQIRQGAPFELFLSADEETVLALDRDGHTRNEGARYAFGRLALIVPNGSPLKPDGSLGDLGAALGDGRLARFAIANPEHAPYGRRAEEALRHAALWDAIRPKLIYGETVAQAAQFATSGNAQGGLIASSLALSPRLTAIARHALIPAQWHAPLGQRMALTKRAGPLAERFEAFMRSAQSRAILTRHGFSIPDER